MTTPHRLPHHPKRGLMLVLALLTVLTQATACRGGGDASSPSGSSTSVSGGINGGGGGSDKGGPAAKPGATPPSEAPGADGAK